MKKILTVTIPSYNTEKYIDECLPTFLHESILEDIEILIVNDGSKDSTLEVASKYEKKFPNSVKVIDKENGGHGSTINRGIQEATGRFFKVIDGDDWVDTEKFVDFVKELHCLQDVDMILNPFSIVNDKTKEVSTVEYDCLDFRKTYEADDVYRMKNNIQMHSITYRTEILKNNRIQLDEKMFYVDQEYNLFPIPYIKKIIYLPQNIYQYRVFTENQSMNFKNLQKNREMHKKVFLSLNSYFEKNMKYASNVKRDYFIRCMSNMGFLQILIYLSMEARKENKQEVLEFIETIKNINLDWNLASPLIKIWAKCRFRYYKIFNSYVRMKMKKVLQK